MIQETVVQGATYTNNKFKWINTGLAVDNENVFWLYIGQWLLICVSTLASGGFIGLFIVSRNLSKMAFYAGMLTQYSEDGIIAFLMSCEIWNIVKNLSFLYTIMALSCFFFTG